ncbi:glutathione S-transferase family protein [Paracoccus zhejiangensis]|uniref:Glutathione S-transferase n=1 Tax=Paracoccus zhejiangensis TaxID=1077935 RepID=A0A2H5EXJ9_9RHOB|nr:glutathione S-transferase family protein [Paracoccus zhejiangensis]AUH64007.1 glutathione S-transferase [Paracoccus zhejiangensis]
MTRAPVTIVTYDWVPPFAQGYVREIRARWAAEEAGIPYRIETVPVSPKSAAHREMQPFEQVPVLKDGDLTLFESGAIALYLAEGTALLPESRRAEVTQWLIAALNSVEPQVMAWVTAGLFDKDEAAAERAMKRLQPRLAQLAAALEGRDWLVGDTFSVADLMMVEVLRGAGDDGALDDHPVLKAYVARATARPGFKKAMADHMAHWTDADRAKAEKQGAPA